MRSNFVKMNLKTAVLAVAVLLLGASPSFAQSVDLTAGPGTATLPDGTSVPMWGYTCGATTVATCAALNPSGGWSPVVITVPYVTGGPSLTVNLTNSLSFGANHIPTSLVIVGQLGGGLGTTATATPSPAHGTQAVTWPIAGAAGSNNPPPQGSRVQSFSTEVAAGATTALTWNNLRPGTYLIESGTHPSIQGPMGLYGILVVTTAPQGTTAGTAYPGVSYNAEVPLLLSEIDPVQNNAVSTAVNTAGFSETMVWSGLPSGCTDPSSTTYHQCYPPAVNYTPLYYMINGVAFSRANSGASLFATAPATGVTGSVLVRLVNAGLRMHVPSIVGSTTTPPIVPTGVTSAAVPGFSLIAEDGNPLPGATKVQSDVFMAAGKTYDVMVNAPAAGATALPIYDRELSLSGNSINRDAGMLAYIGVNGGGVPAAASLGAAQANADTYNSVVAGQTLTVSDLSKGVLANDVNVTGVKVITAPTQGTLTLDPNGTFTYVANSTWSTPDTFTYCGNGATTGPACATVTLLPSSVAAGDSGVTCTASSFGATTATYLAVKTPGVLASCHDGANLPLTVDTTSIVAAPGLTVIADANGGFTATKTGAGNTFTFKAKNSLGVSSLAATATVVFATGSGLTVTVLDGSDKTTQIMDYRWIIEEDRTFYVDPTKTTNTGSTTIVPTFGTNFHTSYMPVVATGCTGPVSCESGQTIGGVAAVCDVGNGACRTGISQKTQTYPSQVVLDPTKRYYISVLPGDAANPFEGQPVGHGMGGAPIGFGQTAVTILTQPTPFPSSTLSVFVFEDDFPLNGENDAGGQILDTSIAGSLEPGLSGFNITLFDDAGGSGDATGQMTYDMFNQPLANALDGYVDPATGQNACPITIQGQGITGTIVTCPNFEADGVTTSPLRGQAVVANMMPGRYGVVATPSADRIARGEEWLQTNTLDGQKAHDSFLRVGEPGYFQEFGPAGYHVVIGFANPKIINSRLPAICNNTDPNLQASNCYNTLTGHVTTTRMSRTPDERLYSSESYDSFSFTQCYISVGDPDGEDFAFTKCDASGNFTLTGLPDGNWRVTVFDQWNDMLVDGLSTPVGLNSGGNHNPPPTVMGDLATNQWQANIYTSTFFDQDGNGVRGSTEPGLTLVSTNNRFRDGSFSNFNNTDLNGNAGFNEIFPLFNWYVIETDSTRYKNTGTHVVYDTGGPADGTTLACGHTGYPLCGNSAIAGNMARTYEDNPLPTSLHVPGAVYCAGADCSAESIATSPKGSLSPATNSTGRIDPPWVLSEGWQGFSGQNQFIEFGKKPYAPGETGGIRGHVIYASTRPFDDPQLLLQTSWEPLVPNVTINLYQEGLGSDGVTQTLTLVDTTTTSSFDNWAQGFRSDGVPNMNCPGQSTSDLFYFSLYNQPMWLDLYNHGGTPVNTIPNNSQFKCYDGMHNWNQVQPAPYDGMYQFPSVTGRNPSTGNTTGTNCKICVKNTDATDPFRFHKEDMLPAGKYVVEVVVPPGYELVKEEDKNILIGDNYIAPAVQEFGGLGNIFILPDQAEIASQFNPNNLQNSTQNLGRAEGLVSHEGDTGSVEMFWPCVGESRIVPDYISLFPQSKEVSPFAGAKRNLCDRKEVILDDQSQALAKFYIFTSTHAAAHFTGVITDDFTSEFDPFSPQFGEKFAPPDLPISIKDWAGNEISRIYADEWGDYNGLTYSTWEVNPPNPTGYAPQMMVTCMNDKTRSDGSTDPLYNPDYSQFCYEIPFMPGQTQYMDTPVVPTSAFSAGYNHADCNYPDATPAIAEVDGDAPGGPWIAGPGNGHPITIKALGDQAIPNYGYSGPSATTAPYNAKTVNRHYGFGAQCTSPTPTSATCNTLSSVSIGGETSHIVSWSDTQIVVTAVPGNIPLCAVKQQTQYGGSAAKCGQLIITAGNGKRSVDAITVTIGGKAPTRITAPIVPMTASGPGSIQMAIDAAKPGDLILIPPGTYNEMLLMWKPVRLQGYGAATTIIDANAHPAGKMNPWRRQVDCLFGMAPAGTPQGFDPSCGSGWTAFNQNADHSTIQVDRLPLEAVVGWDATLNGNLAELLQEPTLMGAYEGAGITVLAKGVDFHTADSSVIWSADTFPTGTTLLTATTCGPDTATAHNPFPSSFSCNPSSIDGLTVTDSSQGGGGIFVHGWGHNLQIANTRVHGNIGTLTGGISVGQGEFPPQNLAPNSGNAAPGSCQDSSITNTQLPYCFNLNVNVHNNAITSNTSIGDELFSATPAGAGGISFCTGADYYKFNFNWICGNLSTGDGGGVAHMGYMWNGDIEHNTIIFNQSLNPTIPTNGGGLLVMGAPDTDPVCGTAADADCPPGFSDGTGPGLLINANLIQGNAADSGSGGGLRLQGVNGTEVTNFPTNPARWYHVTVTNNIISNNVAGWDGAGVSLQDALYADLINNTIVSNDTTATAGVLFDTIGAPLASAEGTNCHNGVQSCPQPAGLVAVTNSTPLVDALSGISTVTCPPNHFAGTSATNGSCRHVSYPYLASDVFWQNRSFVIGIGPLSATYQQNVVTLYNSAFPGPATVAAVSQPQTDATATNGNGVIITGGTGACVSPANYWDIGVRGDLGPGSHDSGYTLKPTYSVLTNTSENGGGTNNLLGVNPTVVSQYCNGSRIPPEFGSAGYQVPPGISDATVPNPIFNLTPSATVDEGNNWINMTWGPLSLTNPTVLGADGNYGAGAPLANYALALGSQAIDYVPTAITHPSTDFFGNPRPDPKVPAVFDVGAVEFQGTGIAAPTLTSITPNTIVRGETVNVTLTGTNLLYASAVSLAVADANITISNVVVVNSTTVTATIAVRNITSPGTRSVRVTTPGGVSNGVGLTVVWPTMTAMTPNSGSRGTTFTVTFTGTGLTQTTGPVVSGSQVFVTNYMVASETSASATFRIDPTAALGARNVTLALAGGGQTSPAVTFTVRGATATISAPSPSLLTGTTTTHSGLVTVTNTATGATAGPFTFTAAPAVAKVGTAGGTFSVIAGGTCTGTTVLAPGGGSCTINVQYVPSGTTTATAHVTITGTGLATPTQTGANFTAN